MPVNTLKTAVLAYLDAYAAAMADAGIPPNGDDFNEIDSGVRHILAGNPAPAIHITEKGR